MKLHNIAIPKQESNPLLDSVVAEYVEANRADMLRHQDEVIVLIYYRHNTALVITTSPSHGGTLGYQLFLNGETVGGRTGRNATFCLLCDYYRPALLQENNDAYLSE